MAQHRLFVVENGEMVLIRDDNGNEVNFESFDEFTKYTGDSLSGKFYIGYEPAINFYQDSEDDTVGPDDMPVAWFEDHITNTAIYAARKADPFYGQNLEQTKETKTNQITQMEVEKSYDPILFEGNYYKPSDAVLNTLQACNIEGQLSADPIYVNGGYWDTIDGVSIAFTVQDLTNLYKTGYDQQAANYTNMKNHISNIIAMTVIEDVINYDFSTGWQ